MTVVPYPQPAPSTALARPSWIEVMDRGLELAEVIANTDFVPKGLRGNQPAILAAILYGHEVGLEPMTSLSTIAVIDGKPTMAAEAQRALILAGGHELTLEESTSTRATWAGRRRGDKTTTRVTWTLDDAKRARLAGRPAWQAYPAAMLSARASAALARAIFPDVIRGMAATEELEGDVDETTPAPVTEGEAPATTTRRRRRPATGSSPAAQPAEPEPPQPPEPSPEPAQPSEPVGESSPAPAEPEAPVAPDAPNKAQMGMLFALFGQKGVGERDARLAFSEKALGRKIASSKELSALDVSRIIEALNAEPDAPATPAEPAPAPAAAADPAAGPEPPAPTETTLPADEQAGPRRAHRRARREAGQPALRRVSRGLLMRAIRAERLGRFEVHWLVDDWTLCGRRRLTLGAGDELELEHLPAGEGCDACDELGGRARPRPRSGAYSSPVAGRLITTGPLNHGAKSRVDRGRRLA